MSEPDRKTLADLATEVGALREAIAELAVLQAEAANAMLKYVHRVGAEAAGAATHRYAGQIEPPTSAELRGRILAIAESSTALVSELVKRNER